MTFYRPFTKIIFTVPFYCQFRICFTKASGKAHTPIMLIVFYHKSAEKARVIFRLRRSDIIATAIVILKPYGFSDILFALKLAKQISLGVSRISLRSNRTRPRRIKLPNFLMRSWAKLGFFILSIKCLLDIGDDVLHVLNSDRKTDKVGTYSALDELLVSKLTVGGGSGVKHAGSCVRDVGNDRRKL